MNIFISANNTECGKTFSTLALIESISKTGLRVGVMKPIETGVNKTPEDGYILLKKIQQYNPNFLKFTTEDIVPIQLSLPAAPYVAGEVDFDKIHSSYIKLKKECDILLIEGAGGILVPVNEKFYMVDFLEFFDAKLFMVFSSKLGMINDFLLNKHYLETQNINYQWAINLFDEDEYFKISHKFMKKFNPKFIQYNLDTITKNLLGV